MQSSAALATPVDLEQLGYLPNSLADRDAIEINLMILDLLRSLQDRLEGVHQFEQRQRSQRCWSRRLLNGSAAREHVAPKHRALSQVGRCVLVLLGLQQAPDQLRARILLFF